MKFIKYIIILLILSILFQTENILACATSSYRCNSSSDDFIVHPTQITETINGATYKTYVLQRQYSEKYVYCLQKGLSAPHVAYGLTDPNYCTSNNFVGENVRAALGYVINTNYGYVAKQHVIHKLMAEAGYGSNPVTYDTTLYNAAKSIRDSYNASPTVTLGNFTLNGNNYEASYSISGATGLGNPTVSVNVGSVSNGKVYVPVTTSTSNGKIDVTITVSYSKQYSLAITKTCGSYQPIAESDTTSSTKTYSDSDTKSITIEYYLDLNGYLDGKIAYDIVGYGTADIYINGTRVADDVNDYYQKWPKGTTYEIKDINALSGKKYNGVYSGSLSGTINSDTSVHLNFSSLGSLKIKKVDSNNDVLAQLTSTTTAKFQLYSDSACKNKYKSEFSATGGISNIDPGTYYLKETEAKKGYHKPESGDKWYCEKITISSGDNEIEVENKTKCEYLFNNSMTMKERIDLYSLIKNNYSQEFNALLDMGKTTAETACANIPITKSYNKGCLSATSTSTGASDFSNTNVSMYTEKYGKYTFCLTKYNLVNNLGRTRFNNIKSGQSIINTSNVVATATLNRVCYNFQTETITDSQYTNLSYSNYVEEDASIDGKKLVKSETSSGTINNKTITATYTLPVMYAGNKEGKIYYGSCASGEYCKVLGRGIISKFNLSPGTYNLGFDIKLKTNKLGSLNTSSDCKYVIENELIDYKNKLNVEFRAVNTESDAIFLSKDGASNRTIGKNWNIITEREREEILNNRNNSYNKNRETALYRITLTPELIREIREDNKEKKYDDYNMTCVSDGTICISNYLTCFQNRGILQIKERKNIDKFRTGQIVCRY